MRRFHLVGHDWGGSLSWEIAAQWPERMASLTMLSRPHPASLPAPMKRTRSSPAVPPPQGLPRARRGPKLLADDAAWLRVRHARRASRQRQTEKHLAVIGNAAGDGGGAGLVSGARHGAPADPTTIVPTLFIWGDIDDTVGRMAAEGTGDFIEAPYRFVELPGVGHYAADQVPERVNALLLEHLAAHPR